MADIFISYAQQDREITTILAQQIERLGYTVWWDFNLIGGTRFRQVILEELQRARAVLVIWSPFSVKSHFVEDEAERARADRKLIPLRTANLKVADIPLGFGGYQAPLVDDYDGVARAIASLLGPIIEQGTGGESEHPANRLPYEPEMIPLKVGQFLMGSSDTELTRYRELRNDTRRWETPQRDVRITKPVAFGRDPVTFIEWNVAVAEGACYKAHDNGWGKGRRPVIHVSWDDAQAYVMWLREKTSKPYRLPSEAEWEYACRAETTTPFHFGPFIDCDSANFIGKWLYDERGRSHKNQTIEVDRCKENKFGLRGMHGNVWEWVQDPWHDSYSGAPRDEQPWASGTNSDLRVIRGGSWKTIAKHVRSAARGKCPKATRANNIGFRVALDL